MCQLVSRVTHLFGDRVGDIYAIHYSDYSRFNRHILIAYRRTCSLAERTHDHFAGSRTKPVGYDDDIASGLLVEIIRMNNQKPDAFKIRRLLGGPNGTYDFA